MSETDRDRLNRLRSEQETDREKLERLRNEQGAFYQFLRAIDPTGRWQVAAQMASGMVAEPVSGVLGVASLPFVGGEGAGDVVEGVQEAMTFQPRTQAGKAASATLGEFAQDVAESPPGRAANWVGQEITSAVDERGPLTNIAPGVNYALARTLPTATAELGGGLVGAKVLRGGKRITNDGRNLKPDLQRQVDPNLTPEEGMRQLNEGFDSDIATHQSRVDELRGAGLEPTKAQVTRDAADFQSQQESAKTSGRVRDALENQEATLSQGFDDAVSGTGGRSVTSGSTAIDEVVGRSTRLDAEITELYTKAREAAPGAKDVRLESLAASLKRKAPSNTISKGLVKSIRGELVARGIIDKDFKVTGRIDVETAEDLRAFINSHFDSTSPMGRGLIRDFKNALDDDVFTAAGGDFFNTARSAKHAFEQNLSRAKVSKFDKRRTSLVRDMLENKLDPDDFAAKVTQSKTYRPADLQQLKDYLSQSDGGKAAWDDLRAETLQSIKDQAFIGPKDANGFQAITRDKLEKILNKIGSPRRNILFSARENQFLDQMLKVAELREPVRGTAIGRGPSAQAIGMLQTALVRSPILRTAFEIVTLDAKGRAVLKVKAPVKPNLRLKQGGAAAGVGTAAAIGATED